MITHKIICAICPICKEKIVLYPTAKNIEVAEYLHYLDVSGRLDVEEFELAGYNDL